MEMNCSGRWWVILGGLGLRFRRCESFIWVVFGVACLCTFEIEGWAWEGCVEIPIDKPKKKDAKTRDKPAGDCLFQSICLSGFGLEYLDYFA